jgi:urease accessory protein
VSPVRCDWRLKRLLPLCFLLFGGPAPAQAHTAIKGMGEVINGLLHPLTTPAHVLILLGLGLWVGQQQPLKLKLPVLIFAPLSLIALELTCTAGITNFCQPVLIGIAMCAGALVALERPLPPLAAGILFAAAAISLGLDSGVESRTALAVQKTLLGTWVSLVALLVDIAIYVSFATQKWARIGIRVIGSWITAISLLMLAFFFRK